jgi:hypothetical protein
MWKASPWTVIFMVWQHTGLVSRSPLATATQRPLASESMMPTSAALSVSMKLWVDPESRSVSKPVQLMVTVICMVRLARG